MDFREYRELVAKMKRDNPLHDSTTVVIQTENGLLHEIKDMEFETHEGSMGSTLYLQVKKAPLKF